MSPPSICDDYLWESSANDSFLRDGIDSLTSLKRTRCSSGVKDDERSTVEVETIVTSHSDDDFESACEQDSQSLDEEEEGNDNDDEYESVSSCYPQGVPAEVNVSFCENDNDDDDDSECCDQHDHSDSESELDADEEEVDSEEEEDNDAIDDDDDSEGQYETDEDSIASEHSEEDDASVMDDSSCCSTPSTSNTISHDLTNGDDHDLFLPWDVSPSVESLKYEEEDDDDGSSDEEDDDDDVPSHYLHRTYMIGNNRSGRPRMWDGCPSSISVSSNSSSSSDDGSRRSQDSKSSKTTKQASKAGVSFSDSVTVYPVFQTRDYSPAMVRSIYTKRDELRVNKLRNKREYAYDLHDWRNATEEVEMEENEEGEMVHPVHVAEKKPISSAPCRTRNVVQTYSSALGGYSVGTMSSSGMVHRAKRMRMYYP